MSEEKGIEQTKEMIAAMNELAIFLISRFKDGVQMKDFLAMYTDLLMSSETKAIMKKAYDGYEQIPAEIKDIDLIEATELISEQISLVPMLIASLKA